MPTSRLGLVLIPVLCFITLHSQKFFIISADNCLVALGHLFWPTVQGAEVKFYAYEE